MSTNTREESAQLLRELAQAGELHGPGCGTPVRCRSQQDGAFRNSRKVESAKTEKPRRLTIPVLMGSLDGPTDECTVCGCKLPKKRKSTQCDGCRTIIPTERERDMLRRLARNENFDRQPEQDEGIRLVAYMHQWSDWMSGKNPASTYISALLRKTGATCLGDAIAKGFVTDEQVRGLTANGLF